MADNKVNMPAGFGGLTRFSERYSTKFNLKPTHVIIFIVVIIVFRVFLGIIF